MSRVRLELLLRLTRGFLAKLVGWVALRRMTGLVSIELILGFRILQHVILVLVWFLLAGGDRIALKLLVLLPVDWSVAASLFAILVLDLLVLVLDDLILVNLVLILHLLVTLRRGRVFEVRLLRRTLLRTQLLGILLRVVLIQMLLTVVLILGRVLQVTLALMEIVDGRVTVVEKAVVLHGLLSRFIGCLVY